MPAPPEVFIALDVIDDAVTAAVDKKIAMRDLAIRLTLHSMFATQIGLLILAWHMHGTLFRVLLTWFVVQWLIALYRVGRDGARLEEGE